MNETVLLRLKRLLTGLVVLGVFLLVLLVSAWNMVFHYCRPGEMLVVFSKSGSELPPGQLLAGPGQKGPLREVLGEGRHFVWPVLYEVETVRLADKNMEIPPLKIGVVTAKVGKVLPKGRILADEGERGIRREVLPPGRHRLNPYAYIVEIHDATVIKPGFVGFVTRLVGKAPQGRFADPSKDEKGILKDVLQPGIYYLNPYEYKVDQVEVGLNQVSFLGRDQISFPSADAFDIALDATVEWELEPAKVPEVMDEFGARKEIEDKVLIAQSRSIGRLEGSRYGAKQFLLGEAREEIQENFTRKLTQKCAEKHVKVHSAYIRHISIPDNLLQPIRQSFVAREIEKTAAVQEATKKSAAELERETRLIEFKRQEALAETQALVQKINAETTRSVAEIRAKTRQLVAAKQREIAVIEAERTEVLGKAKAEVEKMLGAARASKFEFEVKAFGGDADAFARYSFASGLPSELNIRLIQTGEGTFWTDLGRSAGLGSVGPVLGRLLEESRRAARGRE
ncbi:MAG: hypothetical protein D6731_20530 [Planctomycetota bacterium]|nr:MAG: hypothetical protein D6731_20530 [Planctomycetota bacterium]